VPLRVVTTYAWHSLFARNLFIIDQSAPEGDAAAKPSSMRRASRPIRRGTRSDVLIALNFAKGLVLIGGTSYAGENQEVGLQHDELLVAVPRRAADALLGERRGFGRRCSCGTHATQSSISKCRRFVQEFLARSSIHALRAAPLGLRPASGQACCDVQGTLQNV
jgi:hypothetical protein